ncbi:dihydrofolate reductase family protein [Cellulomonas sp. S1-8]|uniref:dihydrofolate reductase family protein n=1 Tax=Cellulomonas sp. S1-8 TaxID=2904790 RepID=UPI002244E795|nr:dihydrofolate reductase family protein [Cellulomonas sp. S1-8]UZN03653.1 dihydrofolate reductase family protein [Cellulomonas sp. S1-8]
MGRLLYALSGSLDGYVNDAQGRYDFMPVSEGFHAFITDAMADVTTHLYGRRMYEEMQVWETDPTLAESAEGKAFAAWWQRGEKVVFSTTLTSVPTARTRIERTFDVDRVREIKERSAGDLIIEGPTIAAHALRAGLVDEIQLYVGPAILGGGTRVYPDDVRLDLELLAERRFDGGVVMLRYAVR